VYDFGRITAQIKGREAAYAATNSRVDQQANQIAIEVVSTCLEYNKQRALLFAADDYVKAVQNLVDMLAQVTDADPGRRGELVQAKSRLLQAIQARENARSFGREFRIRLDRLLGSGKQVLCDGLGARFLQKPDLDAVRNKIRDNPQVKALNYDYESALRQLDQINASRKPQVQASAAHAPIAAGLSNTYYQSFTLSVTMPLYDGGESYASIRQSKEVIGQRRLELDSTREKVRADVVSAWSQLEAAKARIQSANAQVEAATIALNGIREEAKVGQRTTLDVLLTDQDLLSARVSLVTAQRDRVVSSYTLAQSAGQLNIDNLKLNVKQYNPATHYENVSGKWFGISIMDGE
jgi:outer membrane protein